MRIDDLIPWTDRAGRFSRLHGAAFALVVAPALWIAYAFATGALGAEPLKAATHLTGTWTLYLLLASLAVTPLKGLLAWSRLVAIRRMLGVAAFAYIAGHLTLYIGDQSWNLVKVASEIASRIYLTIGFAALLGLAVLAATSFDAAMRRLKRNWKRLHRAVYFLTALGLLHFFMQSKSDVSEAVLRRHWSSRGMPPPAASPPSGCCWPTSISATRSGRCGGSWRSSHCRCRRCCCGR